MVLHFDFLSAGGGPRFDFVWFLLKERGRKRAVGWVSIWGRSEVSGERGREERVVSGSSWGGRVGDLFSYVRRGIRWVGVWGRRTDREAGMKKRRIMGEGENKGKGRRTGGERTWERERG